MTIETARILSWPLESFKFCGVTLKEFQIVEIPKSWLERIGVEYDEVFSDGSQVGTRLTELFKSLGYKATSTCGCEHLANTLDSVSLEFIERHREKVVNQIVQSAAQQSVSVPHAVINRILGYVMWKERRRLKTLPKLSDSTT